MAISPARRRFLQSVGFLGAAWQIPGLLAAELAATPSLTEGPFYPDELPLDTDNDLVVLNDSLTPAIGEITHLSGRVMGPDGRPIRNAFVEIWQVDGNGVYIHSADNRKALADKNFQGYGRFVTDADGRYYFRTIKPVPYPGRAPHIHVGVSQFGRRILTTQLLIRGNPQNERDGVFRNVTDAAARERLLVDFDPLPDSTIGELRATFDLVLGRTPPEPDEAEVRRGIGPSELSRRGSRGAG